MRYNYLMAQEKRCLIKVEILNKDMTIINNIEGDVLSGNITIDAESDIRRTCNLSIHITSADYYPTENSQMFLNKYIRVFIGIQINSSDEIEWVNMGIYAYSTLGYNYDSENNNLNLAGVDLMSELTGARDGNIEAQDVTIEATKGTDISTVMSDILRQMTRFKDYNIDTIGSEYNTKHSNYTGASYTELPYDISVESSPTIYNILTSLSTLYPNWEIYFDVNGVFNCHMIPDGQFEPNVLTDDILQPLLISENINIDWQNIYNKISVWGALLEPDITAEKDEVSIDTNQNNYTLYNIDIKDVDEKSQSLSDLLNNQKLLSFTIPIDEEIIKNYKLVNLANGEGYYVKNDIILEATPIDASKCFIINDYIIQDVEIKEDGTVLDKEENDITETVVVIDGVAIKKEVIIKNIKIINGQIYDENSEVIIGAYAINTDNGDLVAILPIAITNGTKWGYGSNIILNSNEFFCRAGQRVKNYSGSAILMNPSPDINNTGSKTDINIVVINGFINSITLSDGTTLIENLDKKYTYIYDNFLNKYILLDKNYYIELPNDNENYVYIPNNFIINAVGKQPGISFEGDRLASGGHEYNYCIPVFPDNETIKYNYQVQDENNEYIPPKLLPDISYVYKYVDISNYKTLTAEQFLYYIQIFCIAYRASISAENINNFQSLQNELNNATTLTKEIYDKGISYIQNSGFYTKGYFLYLGKLQIQATYSVTDPTNPFNVDNIGEIVKVYEGEDKESITSNNLALQRAKWEAYKSTRLQKQLDLTCLLIPDLDVNKKISFTSNSTQIKSEYFIKSISHDLSSWTTTISAPEYFPYYEPDEKTILLGNPDFARIDIKFNTDTCVLKRGGTNIIYKYRTEPYITEISPKPGYYFFGWKNLDNNETIELSPRLTLQPVGGILSDGSFEPICLQKTDTTQFVLNCMSSDDKLGIVSEENINVDYTAGITVTANENEIGEFVSWTNYYTNEVVSYNKDLIFSISDLKSMKNTVYQANFRYKNYKRDITFDRTYDESISPTNDVGSLTNYSITIGKDLNGFDYTPVDGVLTTAISDEKATFVMWIDPAGNVVSDNSTLYADMFETKTYPSGINVDTMPENFIAVYNEHLKDIDIFYRIEAVYTYDCILSKIYEQVYDSNGNFVKPIGCTATFSNNEFPFVRLEFKYWKTEDGIKITTDNYLDVYAFYNNNKKNIRKSMTFIAVYDYLD